MKKRRRVLAPAFCGAAALAIVMTIGAASAVAKKDGTAWSTRS